MAEAGGAPAEPAEPPRPRAASAGAGAAAPLLPQKREPSVRRKDSPLPDLTEKLIEYGIYDQYTSWRDGYRRWRQGEAKGARGEATIQHMEESQDSRFKYFYPDQFAYSVRETLAYWISVCFIEGSILFGFAAWLSAFGSEEWPNLAGVLPTRASFAGAVLYILGCYMIYFEVINIGVSNNKPLNIIWCNWRELFANYNVAYESVTGAVSYTLGAAFFQVALSYQLGEGALFDVRGQELLVDWPNYLGGWCFFAGGICEIVYNRVWSSPPTKLTWWVAVSNCCGDVCFLISVQPRVDPRNQYLATLIGAILFTAGGILQLVMWRSGQFGLSFLHQLNVLAKSRHSPLMQHRYSHAMMVPTGEEDRLSRLETLSPRTLVFVFVYALAGSVSILCCCFCRVGWHRGLKGSKQFSISSQELLNVFIMHMILVLHSAGLNRVPAEQPYKFLVIAVRVVALAMLAHSVLNIWIFMQEDY